MEVETEEKSYFIPFPKAARQMTPELVIQTEATLRAVEDALL
jgi:uncharacterized protein YjeT (DUF2065 family)